MHGNGKILLTGEYFILDGAVGLALPTVRYGQSLKISKGGKNHILTWRAEDETGVIWLEITIQMIDFHILSSNDMATATVFIDILKKIRHLNPDFLQTQAAGIIAHSKINFPRIWGLGTSSTLTYLLAKWADIDPQLLNNTTFKSSGYDVACAEYDHPIFYQKNMDSTIKVEKSDFKPNFLENLYFVHLGNKQNSREGITLYKKLDQTTRQNTALEISKLTALIAKANTLNEFETHIQAHETLVADTLHLATAQNLHFSDFWGQIKSLGAWGGDFVLATSDHSPTETIAYFKTKGFETVLKYADLF
jgi:mevalonate kinase